jgi:tetratricopeptide (TPR) repeat protein
LTRIVLALLLSPLAAWSQAAGAYEALRARDYDRAIPLFLDAIRAQPDNPGLRKDLAYTWLKAGDTEAAREQFGEAMRIAADDTQAALEYAFLCYETRHEAEARRVFGRLRQSGDPAVRATAGQAFENIDRPLGEGIARWSKVAAAAPDNFSAHAELARLAEQRGDLELAAKSDLAAWRLRPRERSLLVDLGRVWRALGNEQQAQAAFLAASRDLSTRVSEQARERLPARYPYVSEFRDALALDGSNTGLRRELGYLLLAMDRKPEAEREFEEILRTAPDDLLSAAQLGFLRLGRGDREGALVLLNRVLESGDEELAARVRAALHLPADLRRRGSQAVQESAPSGAQVRELAERSYRAGYLKDALKYLSAAQEDDPVDFSVMLKLGWTHNMLRQDSLAIGWFDLARRSPDPAIAAEARKAYRNLRPSFARFRTTAWVFPFYSSRWHDVFSYGQIKEEMRLGNLPFRPYVSLRFAGDTRRTTGGPLPEYLSETSLIAGAGLASRPWHGLVLWGEAGSAMSYLNRRDRGRMMPDYRGGASAGRGFGRPLASEAPGWFAEAHADAVFMSRFDRDVLLYSQNMAGYTLPQLGGLRLQVYANGNLTADTKLQDWANFVEAGPGLRFRWEGLPPSLAFSVNALRGVHTRAHKPGFSDFRAGFWYAFTR